MEELIRKFKPIYYLHKQEKFYPCPIISYLQKCTVHDSKSGKILIDERKILTPKLLYDECQKQPILKEKSAATLEIRPNFDYYIRGESDLNKIPIYSNIVEYGGKTYINYVTFFSYNHHYIILKLGRVGNHYADIEHITVQLNQNKQLERIYYSQHSGGIWLKPGEFGLEGTHPVAYISNGSHAIYSKPGNWIRLYGFANDITEKGFQWDAPVEVLYNPGTEKFNINTMGFLDYYGDWGFKHVSGFITKSWWKNPQNQITEKMPIYFSNNIQGWIFNANNVIIFLVYSIIAFIVLFIIYKWISKSKKCIFKTK